MNTVRTTIVLKPSVLRNAKEFAATKNKTISQLIEEGLEKLMEEEELLKIKHMHETLKRLSGAGGKGHKDASTTIDEVLYGENGAWRGSRE